MKVSGKQCHVLFTIYHLMQLSESSKKLHQVLPWCPRSSLFSASYTEVIRRAHPLCALRFKLHAGALTDLLWDTFVESLVCD